MYLGVGRYRRRRFLECSSIVVFWYLIQIPGINQENITGGNLGVSSYGNQGNNPLRNHRRKLSCGGLGVLIADGLFEK